MTLRSLITSRPIMRSRPVTTSRPTFASELRPHAVISTKLGEQCVPTKRSNGQRRIRHARAAHRRYDGDIGARLSRSHQRTQGGRPTRAGRHPANDRGMAFRPHRPDGAAKARRHVGSGHGRSESFDYRRRRPRPAQHVRYDRSGHGTRSFLEPSGSVFARMAPPVSTGAAAYARSVDRATFLDLTVGLYKRKTVCYNDTCSEANSACPHRLAA